MKADLCEEFFCSIQRKIQKAKDADNNSFKATATCTICTCIMSKGMIDRGSGEYYASAG